MSSAEAPAFVSEQPAVGLPFDGGARAWSTLVGGWLAIFATFGYANSFGVYQDFYTRSTTASSSSISWIGSIQLFFLLFMGFPAGKFLDNGHFRIVLFTGSTIYVLSLFMLSLAHPQKYYQIFLSQGVGMGVGAGLIYLPSIAVQAHHWRAHRSLAMGVVITGTSFGGIIYPIMLNQLFKGSAGFSWGVRASGFLTLAILVAANCLMTARPSLSMNRTASSSSTPKFSSLLLDTPYMLTIVGSFFVFWGLFFPYFYLQLFSILKGVDINLAFYTLAIQNAASIFGRTTLNVFADKFGVLNTLSFVSFCIGIMVFALFGISTTGAVIVFSILYGFFSGGFSSLLAPATASLSNDMNEIGLRMGISFFVTSFASLTGTPIDGALLGHSFPWFKPIIFSGTVILAGIPLLVIGRTMQATRKKTQRV